MAVTVAFPTGKRGPVTVRVASDTLPTPTNGEAPNMVRPIANVTVPTGTADPGTAAVTVAVSCTGSPSVMLEGLAASEVEVAAAELPHCVMRL